MDRCLGDMEGVELAVAMAGIAPLQHSTAPPTPPTTPTVITSPSPCPPCMGDEWPWQI